MKYIVIIGDGMADRPLEELNGLTPLQKAHTPNMDKLSKNSLVGKVKTIPDGFQPGSDVANLSILGYDPAQYYSGRAPLEAASMGIALGDDDVAYRCNLVTLQFDEKWTDAVMEDYSAGHISTDDAHELMHVINKELGSDSFRFYPGISYRHLMVWAHGSSEIDCTPPHDITGKKIADFLPKGNGSEHLLRLQEASITVFHNHPVNRSRQQKGKSPANSIWLWGQGKRPSLPTFEEKYGIRGALISAVDLTKGLGVYAGFQIIDVPGATGYLDTNYEGKASYALNALKEVDFVYIHVEAPDEAGHNGNIEDKVRAIEDLDRLVVGKIMNEAGEISDDYRLLVMPDHATPIQVRTHTDDPVPFVLFDSRNPQQSDFAVYSEDISNQKGVLTFDKGYTLMDFLISRSN